jgi:ribonuclease P protein component
MAVTRSSDAVPAADIDSRIKTGLSKQDFDRIFDRGLRTSGRFCRLLVHPGSGRVGVSTPKSVGCHARRNRLKRRGREAVRKSMALLRPDLDHILAMQASADQAVFAELCQDVADLLQRAYERWESK